VRAGITHFVLWAFVFRRLPLAAACALAVYGLNRLACLPANGRRVFSCLEVPPCPRDVFFTAGRTSTSSSSLRPPGSARMGAALRTKCRAPRRRTLPASAIGSRPRRLRGGAQPVNERREARHGRARSPDGRQLRVRVEPAVRTRRVASNHPREGGEARKITTQGIMRRFVWSPATRPHRDNGGSATTRVRGRRQTAKRAPRNSSRLHKLDSVGWTGAAAKGARRRKSRAAKATR